MSDSHPDDKPRAPAANAADRAAQSREAAARLSELLSKPLPPPTPQEPAKSEAAAQSPPDESVAEPVLPAEPPAGGTAPPTESAGTTEAAAKAETPADESVAEPLRPSEPPAGEPALPTESAGAAEAAAKAGTPAGQPPEASVAGHVVPADVFAGAAKPPEPSLPVPGDAVDQTESVPQPQTELAEVASNREPGPSEGAADTRMPERAALLEAMEKELASLPQWPAAAPVEDRAEASPPPPAANRNETMPPAAEATDARAPSSQPDEPAAPLDAAAARLIARVRRLMLISTAVTFIAVAAVLSVVGYRVFNAQGSMASPEARLVLPRGARIIRAGVANERLVLTLDIGGVTEVRTFDVATLQPTGRLSFEIVP